MAKTSIPCAKHLASLISSGAESADICALAQALAPFDLLLEDKTSLLREAACQTGSQAFSFKQLELLASCGQSGAREEWKRANRPEPFARWLEESFFRSHHSGSSGWIDPKTLLKMIEVSSPQELMPRKEEAHFLVSSFLIHSADDELGLDCAIALSKKTGQSLFEEVLGAERVPLIFQSPSAAALDFLLKEKPALLMKEFGGAPFHQIWRERAQRGGNTGAHLAGHLLLWAEKNDTDRERQRLNDEYFAKISRYGGEDSFKSRKDWTSATDRMGRSVPMALSGASAHAIKHYWSVKKAEATAKIIDREGRSLWHWLLAHGQKSPSGTAKWLSLHCAAIAPDKTGNGVIPSIRRMKDKGITLSEHEWLFPEPEMESAIEHSGAKDAQAWFGCADAKEARSFASWMAFERYLGSGEQRGYADQRSRSSIAASHLCLKLDTASFSRLDPEILGALALNLSFCASVIPGAEALAAKILSMGARMPEADSNSKNHAQRLEQIFSLTPKSLLTRVQEAFGAHKEASLILAKINEGRDPEAFAKEPEAPKPRI